jgi:phage terminase small subunit
MSESIEENKYTPIKLTNKQKVFVEEYLRSWNATAAAIAAGYSEKSARLIGHENITKPYLKAEIDRRIKEKIMTADEVLTRMSDMARASHFPFIRISEDGFVYFDFSHPDAKNYFHLIKKIKTKRQRRFEGRGEDAEEWEDEWVEVELHDAQSALVTLAKYHSLLTDKMPISANLDLSTLTDHQLLRLKNGDNVLDVLADKS